MRERDFLWLFLMVASLSFGCSGGTDTGSPANGSAPASNNAVAVSNTNKTVSPNSANPAENVPPAGVIETVNKRKLVDTPSSRPPPLRYEPAAEDSQIATAMDSSGRPYEVRIFKRHPQLVKVESTWLGPNQKALSIVLRDGKVHQVTTDRIANLKLATAAQILELIGIQPAKPSAGPKTGVKKAQ